MQPDITQTSKLEKKKKIYLYFNAILEKYSTVNNFYISFIFYVEI